VNPNEVDFGNFELANYDGSVKMNIKQLALELNVYEDMFEAVPKATVVLQDSNGLYNNYPIHGEERLTLDFKTRGTDEFVSLFFASYSVGKKINTSPGTLMYPINFMHREGVRDPKTVINNFFEGRVSDHIKKLTGRDYPLIEVEETSGLYRFAPTRETQLETIERLRKEAKSATHRSSSYVFFGRTDGFKFVTLEHLFEQPAAATYYYSIANQIDPTINPYNIISHFEIIKNDDLIDGMRGGLFGNTVETIDPLRKSFTKRDFNYFSNRDFLSTKHLADSADGFGRASRIKRGPVAQVSQEAHRSYLISDLHDQTPRSYMELKSNEENVYRRTRHEDLPTKISLLRQTQSTVVKLVIPGDTRRHVGDCINIQFPETNGSKFSEDKYLAGKFLVTSVRHKIDQDDTFTTQMECVKDSFEERISNTYNARNNITLT
jgi:hypothetical protein